jgi:hypothetical protein
MNNQSHELPDLIGRKQIWRYFPSFPVSYPTLCRLSAEGKGPPHLKLAGRIFFRRGDLEAYCRGDSPAFVEIDEAALAARRSAARPPEPLPPSRTQSRRRGRPTKAEQLGHRSD